MAQTKERVRPARAPRAPAGWKRVAANLAVAAALGFFLTKFALYPQPPYGSNPYHDAVRRHLLVFIALGVWLVALLVRRRLPHPTRFDLPFVVLLAAQTAAMLAAPDRRIGLEPTLDLLAAILLFYVLVDIPDLSAGSLQLGLMLMALALSLIALHAVWVQWQNWLGWLGDIPDVHGSLLPPTVPRVDGVGANPNILAPMLTLTVPLYLSALLRPPKPEWYCRIAAAAGLAVVQVAIFFTLSRSAWIGEAAGVAVGFCLVLLVPQRSSALGGPARRLLIVTCVLGAAATVFALGLFATGHRPLWLFRASLAARSDFRVAALHIIAKHVLLGAGPGSFTLLYPLLSNGDPMGAVHSHNVILQIAVDTGLAGLLGFGLVSVGAIRFLWQLWRLGDSRSASGGLVAAVTASVVSFAVNGMGDSLHLFPEILLVLAASMALALRSAREQEPTEALTRVWLPHVQAPRFVAPVLATVLLLAASGLGLLWLRIDQAGRHYQQSLALAEDASWAASAREAQRASSLDPTMPPYHVQTAVSLDVAGTEGALPAAMARSEAIAELRRALALEPRSGATRLDLAVLLAEDGQTSQAATLLPQIHREAPRDSLVLLGDGVLEEEIQPDVAVETYARALAQSPRLGDSPFWQETNFRKTHLDAIVHGALAQVQDGSAGSSGQTVREIIEATAGQPLDRGPSRQDDYFARIERAQNLEAAGDTNGAKQILLNAVAERPDDPSARLALGKLQAKLGDMAEARHQWTVGAYLGDVASILELGDSFPAGQVPSRVRSAGVHALGDLEQRRIAITYQHYRFAYRRHEPAPVVLPGHWYDGLPQVYSDLQTALHRWETNTQP